MIGGITKGSDFAGCVRYALALDEAGKEARLLYSEGVLTDTPQDIINGFLFSANLPKKVSPSGRNYAEAPLMSKVCPTSKTVRNSRLRKWIVTDDVPTM